MPRGLLRRMGALVLLAAAFAGGPGLTALEIRSHSEPETSPHAALPHFEPLGGQDHSDRCEIGLLASLARAPVGGCPVLRMGVETIAPHYPGGAVRRPAAPGLLPPSRGPPRLTPVI